MISFVRGLVSSKRANSVVLDVSGIGYEVFVFEHLLQDMHLGDEVTLQTAHIIREDSQVLFGFNAVDELNIFNLLCSVSGVGPKMAMAILSSIGVSGVNKAVHQADDQMFKSVSGVGPKTAKLIILSLSGKLVTDETSNYRPVQQSVIKALVGLGYSDRVAKEVLSNIGADIDDEAALLKTALANLSKSKGNR